MGMDRELMGRGAGPFARGGLLANALAALLVLCALLFTLIGCSASQETPLPEASQQTQSASIRADIEGPEWFDLSMVPAYSGDPTAEIAGNATHFPDADFLRTSFEEYSPLDELGRCGTAYALVGREIMPTEARESISGVHPSGWHSDRYAWVEGESLFNRCHLIAFQLAGENANELNLITGTRYLNTQGMLPYEERVGDYVRTTGNHVLYRVTPFFEGDNLVASGVLMEAESVEDMGSGVQFSVWCYNVQPGVAIDYLTGDNQADGSMGYDAASGDGVTAYGEDLDEVQAEFADADYVLNVKSHKFHYPDCQSVLDTNPNNRQAFTGTREQVLDLGFEPCGSCRP